MEINGKAFAEEILCEIKAKLTGKALRLVGVLVGTDSKARKFLELKRQAAEQIGVEFRLYAYPAAITTRELRAKIVELGRAELNHGIIVELPLLSHINTQYVLNAIPENKDVDVLSQKAQGAFFSNRSAVLPPAVEAVKIIFEKHQINPRGKNCTVFGYGLLVGKPVSHWLANQGATVSIINEFTANPAQLSQNADIIISGVGKTNLITANLVRDGAIVIDFGPDVDFSSIKNKAALITPPTGGIGPVVVVALLKNLVVLGK